MLVLVTIKGLNQKVCINFHVYNVVYPIEEQPWALSQKLQPAAKQTPLLSLRKCLGKNH